MTQPLSARFLLLTALPEEMEHVATRFPSLRKIGGLDLRPVSEHGAILSGVCGLRAEGLTEFLATCSEYFPEVRDVVLLGCAGGLTDVRALDAALALGHVDLESGEHMETDPLLRGRLALACPSAHPCWFATSGRVLATPEAKQQAHKKTGAWLVEMEGFAVARACRDASLRFASLRWVLDDAQDSIPEEKSDGTREVWRRLQVRMGSIAEGIADCVSRLVAGADGRGDKRES